MIKISEAWQIVFDRDDSPSQDEKLLYENLIKPDDNVVGLMLYIWSMETFLPKAVNNA